MLGAGFSGLRRAAIALPVVWTGAWLGYYGMFSHPLSQSPLMVSLCTAYTDTLRRSHIRQRNQTLAQSFGVPDFAKPPTSEEKEAIKKRCEKLSELRMETLIAENRFASLKFAGRYWNPYVEWREQGAWVGYRL